MAEFSMLSNLTTLIIACVIFLCVALILRHRKNLPPGARGVPLLGLLPTLALMNVDATRRWLSGLARKHDIYSMNVGGQLVVVLTQYTTMRSAFVNAEAVDRPPSAVFKGIMSDPQASGIFLSSGEKWKELRSHTLKFLNGSGTSKETFEELIINEVKKLKKEISTLKGEVFNPQDLLRKAATNIICSVTFGQTFSESDTRYRKFIDSINRLSDTRGLGSIQAMIPVMQRLNFLPGVQETRPLLVNIVEFIGQQVEEHHTTLDLDNPNDYTDTLLRAMKLKKSNNQNTSIDYNSTVLSILDIFLGGIESVVSTLRWSVLYLTSHQEIQQRVQAELDQNIGSDPGPILSDQSKLPFTCAVLCEAQRLGSVVPFVGPHYTSKDTTLFGFNIPRNTIIIGDFWNMNRDTMVWDKSGDPEMFIPERFLDEQGDFNPRNKQLTPFSRGRRLCAGENLAKMELFLFLSHLLKNFTFAFPENSPPVSFDGQLGLTLSPEPFKIIATQRLTHADN